jgi:uncharacterized membrane protein YeaQ/YmgE (transglycosylase-associated protein family)
MLVNILLWCLFGLLAGLVAKFLMGGRGRAEPMGIVITILLGIAGAVIGGFISSHLFHVDMDGFNLTSFAVAVGGAILLLFLYGLVMAGRRSS